MDLCVKIHNFNANGAYDPDKTGTGHQPFGYDQEYDYFSRTKVTSATITIHPLAQTAGPLYRGWLGVRSCPVTGEIADNRTISASVESGLWKWKLLEDGNSPNDGPLSHTSVPEEEYWTSVIDPEEYLFTAPGTGLPSLKTTFQVGYCALNSSVGSNPPRDFLITIDYDIIWFEPSAFITPS